MAFRRRAKSRTARPRAAYRSPARRTGRRPASRRAPQQTVRLVIEQPGTAVRPAFDGTALVEGRKKRSAF